MDVSHVAFAAIVPHIGFSMRLLGDAAYAPMHGYDYSWVVWFVWFIVGSIRIPSSDGESSKFPRFPALGQLLKSFLFPPIHFRWDCVQILSLADTFHIRGKRGFTAFRAHPSLCVLDVELQIASDIVRMGIVGQF